jgi:2-oxo-3-hexenedioate decarboxylase/2-keto-4-pentenoate hydratase
VDGGERIERAAALLAGARSTRSHFGRLPDDLAPRDLAEGYAIQAALLARLEPDLGPRVGHKIGCTTAVMQEYMGIPTPCAGAVLARTLHESPAELELAALVRPGVECELAVSLASDLAEGPFDRERVGAAVASCMASIEVVENRFVDWTTLDVATMVADDFFNAACVLGARVVLEAVDDLAAVRAALAIDGVEIGTGVGEAILGHPLDALAWLAGHAAATGAPLRAGEVVTLGSVVQTQWLAEPCEVVVSTDRLGEVRVRFT